MTRAPFGSRPDPRPFFRSQTHSRAASFLRSALDEGEAYVLVTGGHGTGKTILALKLAGYLKAKGEPVGVYVPTPLGDYVTILRRIAQTLNLAVVDEQASADALEQRLFSYFEAGSRDSVALIVDEAQEYAAETLQQLRLLTEFNHEGYYPLRLFMFATPELLDGLRQPGLKALDERTRRRYQLSGLSLPETKEYIYFRLLDSGAQGSPYFSDAAIQRIQTLTGGVPRRINSLCDLCLSIGASREGDVMGAPVVEEAATNLGLADLAQDRRVPAGSGALPDGADQDGSRAAGDAPQLGAGANESVVARHGERAAGGLFITATDVDTGEAAAAEAREARAPSPGTSASRAMGRLTPWVWRLAVAGLLVAIVVVFLVRELALSTVLQ